MQGESDHQDEFLDVRSLVGHLLPAGSVFALLAEHRERLFPAAMFAELFPSGRGRPSIPAETMASVIVLQTLHGLSDREAAEAVMFDLRWKAACGFTLGTKGFHPSTLTYWRRRLAGCERPHLIFEKVREVITETGAVAGKHRRALDSTVLDDAVARQDTVTQLIAAIRRVARDVEGAQVVVAGRATRLAALTGSGYEQTGKPRIAWDDEQAQHDLVSALVNDALAVLDDLDLTAIAKKPDNESEQQAVALLALVAGQDVEPAAGSDGTDGRWQIARRTAPDRVISTVDTDARHAHKTQSRRQDGGKPVPGPQSDPIAPQNQGGKQGGDEQRPHQPQLLAGDGKDIVIVLEWQVQILLPALSQPQSEQAPGADGVQRLQNLIAGVPGVLLRVEPG